MPIEIKSTLRAAPLRVVVYGRDGVGKSTFFSMAPKPVFIPVESGLENIDALAVPRPVSWDDILRSVDELKAEPRCGSIVLDSLDAAEQLCWTKVCEVGDDKGKKKNIEAFGYGKGYVAALNEWRGLISSLEAAREAGKNILLTAHCVRRSVRNPAGDDYEQWQIKLNEKASGLLREWADVVGFAELDVSTSEDETSKRIKGQSTGRRVLRTQPAAGYEAKTRFALPPRLSLEWPVFEHALKAGSHASLPSLREQLKVSLEQLASDVVADGCAKFLFARGETVASLQEAIATVQVHLDRKKEEEKKS